MCDGLPFPKVTGTQEELPVFYYKSWGNASAKIFCKRSQVTESPGAQQPGLELNRSRCLSRNGVWLFYPCNIGLPCKIRPLNKNRKLLKKPCANQVSLVNYLLSVNKSYWFFHFRETVYVSEESDHSYARHVMRMNGLNGNKG